MSEVLKRLYGERAGVWEQTKAVIDKADAENRGFTAEERQEYDRLNSEIDVLGERIDVLENRDAREREADQYREQAERFIRPESDDRREVENLDSRADAWFRSGARGVFDVPVSGIQVNRSGSGAWEVRDLSSTSATSGGDTVPTSFRRQLMEHLIENSGIRRTRATILTTASGEALQWPKTTAHPGAGTIVVEATKYGESDPVFGRGTLNAYKYGHIIQVPRELIEDTGVDLLGYLARSFGQALGNGSGAHFVTGTGSSQPNGVITAGSLMVTGGTGVTGIPTTNDLIDLFYTVTEPYAQNGEWFMRRATLGKIRKLKDSDGQYLWQPSLIVGQPETLLGAPIVLDPNVPAAGTVSTSVAFGDFSTYVIRDVGAYRFERSDDFAFDTDLVTFRASLRTDGDLMDTTGAIGTYKGGTA